MRMFARLIFVAALVAMVPAPASAQTSAIAGVVKDGRLRGPALGWGPCSAASMEVCVK